MVLLRSIPQAATSRSVLYKQAQRFLLSFIDRGQHRLAGLAACVLILSSLIATVLYLQAKQYDHYISDISSSINSSIRDINSNDIHSSISVIDSNDFQLSTRAQRRSSNTIKLTHRHSPFVTVTRLCPLFTGVNLDGDWPHLHITDSSHWLVVQDVEFVPDVSVDNSNNTIIDVVTWLLPDSLFSMDDLTLYKDPLLLLHEHIQCRAWSDALAMYIDADVSIRQENRYEHVHQFEPTVIRCILPIVSESITALNLIINRQMPKRELQQNALHTLNEYRPYAAANWTLPTLQQQSLQSLDLSLCKQALKRHAFALTVQPVTLDVPLLQVVQWIDYHLFLGFDVINVMDRYGALVNAPELQPYVKAGRLEITYYPFPPGRFIYHVGDVKKLNPDQSLSFRHILGRARQSWQYLVYLDLDEYLVLPHHSITVAPPECFRTLHGSQQLVCQSMLQQQAMNVMQLQQRQIGAVYLPQFEFVADTEQQTRSEGNSGNFSSDNIVNTNSSSVRGSDIGSSSSSNIGINEDDDDNNWLVNNHNLRKPELSWRRTKLLIAPLHVTESWLHEASVQQPYTAAWPLIDYNDNRAVTPMTIQMQFSAADSMYIHHYVSLTKERSSAFMAGKLSHTVTHVDELVVDGDYMLTVTEAIDFYRASHEWPMPAL